MAKMQSPVLQQPSALIMTFQHCYFEGVETFSIHCLGCPNLHEEFDYFHVSICCSVMEQSIITIVPLVVSLQAIEDLEKYLVLVVTDGYHQGCSSIVVGLFRVEPSFQ